MIDGVRRYDLVSHADHRGALTEVCPADRADELGVAFVQDNLSVTRRGVVRGLHYQRRAPQGKLVTVVAGAIFDVAVDLRRGSPSFGRWSAVELGPGAQLWLPPGCAHGLQAISEADAVVLYKLTAAYAPDDDRAIRWDDPTLAIPWPIAPAVVSARDAAAPGWGEAELP